MDSNLRPKLRLLEPTAGNAGGHEGIGLSDPRGLFEGTVFVPSGLIPLLQRFTGEATVSEIAADLSAISGAEVSIDIVAGVVADLDQRLCLEGERFDRAVEAQRKELDVLQAWPAVLAGSAGYPADSGQCVARLDQIVGAVPATSTDAPRMVGVIAPHIDLARGERGYKAAYAALAAAPVSDLYVLFGTAHKGPERLLVPTRKDFVTPLGTVSTDGDFVDAVAQTLGEDPYREEYLHLREHSVAFQALFLQHLAGDRPIRIAPFLTGCLPDNPQSSAEVTELVEAITGAVRSFDGSVTFAGGADMAHMGPFFGDAEPVADELLTTVEQLDRHSLELLEQRELGAFFEDIEGDGNPRRICGTVPMYLVARLTKELAPDCRAELLDYGQAPAGDGSQVVTFASMAFRDG